MIDEQHAPIVVIEGGSRCVVRRPVRVHDGCRVIVVVVIRAEMDVRRRKERRHDGRRDEQRGGRRPADPGRNHAAIMDHEAVARIVASPRPCGPFQMMLSRQVPAISRSLETS